MQYIKKEPNKQIKHERKTERTKYIKKERTTGRKEGRNNEIT